VLIAYGYLGVPVHPAVAVSRFKQTARRGAQVPISQTRRIISTPPPA